MDKPAINLDQVQPLAKERGATSFGAVGTCWGSYPVVRLSSRQEFRYGLVGVGLF